MLINVCRLKMSRSIKIKWCWWWTRIWFSLMCPCHLLFHLRLLLWALFFTFSVVFFAILFPAKLFFHYFKLLMCYHHHRRYYCTRGSLRVFKPNKKHCQHGCLHSCECWLLLILFVCHSVTATVCFCYGGFHYCQVWCYQSTEGERCEEMGWPPSTDAVQQASYAWCNDG